MWRSVLPTRVNDLRQKASNERKVTNCVGICERKEEREQRKRSSSRSKSVWMKSVTEMKHTHTHTHTHTHSRCDQLVLGFLQRSRAVISSQWHHRGIRCLDRRENIHIESQKLRRGKTGWMDVVMTRVLQSPAESCRGTETGTDDRMWWKPQDNLSSLLHEVMETRLELKKRKRGDCRLLQRLA